VLNQFRIAASAGLEASLRHSRTVLRGTDSTSLRFRWDGAATDLRRRRTVLLEAEMRSIQRPHVEWHLGRLLLLQSSGFPVHGVIWICQEPREQELVKVLLNWIGVQRAAAFAPGPLPMEIRFTDGTLAWSSLRGEVTR
jgi:hypothetical protein